MINSLSLHDRINGYIADGWIVDGMIATFKTANSTKSRRMEADGCYDTWRPLPKNPTMTGTKQDDAITRALECNKRIDAGEIFRPNPALPTAWVDYEGLERNKAIMREAIKAVKADLAKGKQLYVRDGSRYVRL